MTSQAAQEKFTSPRLVRVEEGPKPNYLLLDLIRDAVLMSAAHYDLFQSKPSHEKLRAIISGISDHHLFAIEREAATATPSLDATRLRNWIAQHRTVCPVMAATADELFAALTDAESVRLDEGSATPDQGKG